MFGPRGKELYGRDSYFDQCVTEINQNPPPLPLWKRMACWVRRQIKKLFAPPPPRSWNDVTGPRSAEKCGWQTRKLRVESESLKERQTRALRMLDAD